MIDRIHVLKPIRFESVRRNELGSKISASKVSGAMRRKSVEDLYALIEDDRQQRAATVLKDVVYVIEAHAVLTPQAGEGETVAKHIEKQTLHIIIFYLFDIANFFKKFPLAYTIGTQDEKSRQS